MKANLLVMVNERLINAETALKQATDENLIQLCRDYLQLLFEYRNGLYKLRGTPEISIQQSSLLEKELVLQTRKAIRASIETTVQEINAIEFLLKSLTAISGYDAAATFNRLGYQGYTNWELKAGGVGSPDHKGKSHLSIQEAVEAAGVLRRRVYLIHKIVF